MPEELSPLAGPPLQKPVRPDARLIGSRRDRALLRTLVAGGGAQLAIVAGQLLSLPFVARNLSTEEFGVYISFAALVVMLGFADLGVGATLITKLAVAVGEEDADGPRRIIASGVAVTAVLALAVGVLGVLAAQALPWLEVLNVASMRPSSLQESATVAAIVTACGLIGSVSHKILYGLQRGGTANVWLVLAALIATSGTVLLSLGEASVQVYLVVGPGSSALVSLACLIWLMSGWHAPTSRIRLRDIDSAQAVAIVMSSGWFAVIAAAAAIAYQTDTVIVASALGAASAGVYGVALRLFAVLRNAAYPALMQLWPAFAEAFARGDVVWVQKRLPRVVAVTAIVAGTASLCLAVLAPHIVALWLSPDLVAQTWIYVAMGLWVTYGLTISPYFFLLNAAGLVRLHAGLTCLVALANLPLSLLLADQVGMIGPILGSLISHVMLAGVPAVRVCNRLLKQRG